MRSYKNNMEQDNTVDLKMKLVNVLIFKVDIQVLNQKSELDNIFLLDVQKKSVKGLKDFLRRDKKMKKINQIIGHYLKGTKN